MPQTDIELLRRRLIKRAREDVKEAYAGKEIHIIKAVNLLSDLDNIFNLIAEQAKEWHSINFPELSRIVRDNGVYLGMVQKIGERKNFTDMKKVSEACQSAEKAAEVCDAAKNSTGAEISDAELDEIKALAANALGIRDERNRLTFYIEKQMADACPNFSKLAGAVLGARLLAKAGSLRKLALVPSSTMQVFGAEKALFQAMKHGSKGPKHGLILQHPLVASAKPSMRGRMARALAGKLSIAARTDFFGKRQVAEKLGKELQERAETLRTSVKK